VSSEDNHNVVAFASISRRRRRQKEDSNFRHLCLPVSGLRVSSRQALFVKHVFSDH
jgi:hypothetical protein